jgi:glycosyltransferase involved in cell wall biosynthesis
MNKQVKNGIYNLPDPIENDISSIDVAVSRNIKEKYAIKGDNKNLLVFGSIDYRKNIITIIDSLRLLPPEIKKSIHLIIAGKLYQKVRESYIEYIERYKDEISIIYNDEFVNGEEREPLFQNCDLVLMAYVNFFSASSVLGHSIIHNKNVVASNKGIIGRIVTENNIGITVDPTNPNEIKEAIRELLTNHSNFKYNSEILVDEFSPIKFSPKTLIKLEMFSFKTYKEKLHFSVNFYSVFLLINFIPDFLGISGNIIKYGYWGIKLLLAWWIINKSKRSFFHFTRTEPYL